MKHISNQRGLTLIELLATVVVLSIVVAIVSSILFNGLKLSNKVENKAKLQQEANYVTTILKEQHQYGEKYEIRLNAEGKIILTNLNTNKTTTIGNDSFTYVISEIINSCMEEAIDCTETVDSASFGNKISVDPLVEDFHVKIKIIPKKNSEITYEITTILSRM
ncbi:PilW family protein [Ureibacillus sp. GCM10028918]|uniref:PilW family protein n=1 Tax=Ureibacillus sp. GCM10028918 TaxID=3273429 RepID=UPI003608EF91